MLPAPFCAMDPSDDLGWLALADWLEENDRPDRAELVRLTRLLRHDLHRSDRPRREERLRELLAADVEPCVATLTNSIGMEFAYIPAGTFLMGSPEEEEGRSEDEGPIREVTITKSFYLGRYAVTQGEYEAVMGGNPSRFSATGDGRAEVEGLNTSRFPVERVFHDAVTFCKELSARKEEREKGRRYRLPTEAEWEYACRAGTTTPFSFGETISTDRANYDGNYTYGPGTKGIYRKKPTPVGKLSPPNAWGLFDMHGNVWEWCNDWYGSLDKSDIMDPQGPQTGEDRVLRGGSWSESAGDCRAAYRYRGSPDFRRDGCGFRVVLCLD